MSGGLKYPFYVGSELFFSEHGPMYSPPFSTPRVESEGVFDLGQTSIVTLCKGLSHRLKPHSHDGVELLKI